MSDRKRTPEHVDWEVEDQFNYTETLSLPEWAWEFLRRHPDYRKDWEGARQDFRIVERSDRTITIRADNPACSLLRWGCLYSSPPIGDARSARVLWQPDLCSHVLRLKSLRPTDGTVTFALSNATCSSLLLLGYDDKQHVVFGDNGRRLQLAVDGEDIRQSVTLVCDNSLPSSPRNQLRWQRCFEDLQWGGRLMPSYFRPEPHSDLLKRALIALDGSLAGAPQRQIAMAIFGASAVSEKWDAPGRPLRDKVRRAIRTGRRLMSGGYRNLLR